MDLDEILPLEVRYPWPPGAIRPRHFPLMPEERQTGIERWPGVWVYDRVTHKNHLNAIDAFLNDRPWLQASILVVSETREASIIYGALIFDEDRVEVLLGDEGDPCQFDLPNFIVFMREKFAVEIQTVAGLLTKGGDE